MFGKSHRFHVYGSLKGVYERGQSIRGPQISLKVLQRDPRRAYRVAVVVSRKVSKSAVTRNRIRRRVYEQIRLSQEAIKPGTDLVFTVFSDKLAEIDAPKLQSIIKDLIGKAP